MPLVQFKNGTSSSDVFDITLDSPPATNNALILIYAIDTIESVNAAHNSGGFDEAITGDNVRRGGILFRTSITAGISVVSVTRDAPGTTIYTLLEVSGLQAITTPDASASNLDTNNSPTVDLTTVASQTFIVAGLIFSTATITAFGGSGFKSFSTVNLSGTSLDAAFKEVSDTDTYTHSATLSGSDDWVAVIASFALVPEETVLAEMAETEEATVALPVNSFTGPDIEAAFRGAHNKFTVRTRAVLLDPDLVPYYELKGMLADGQVSGNADAAIIGAAQLKFLEVLRDSQHSAPLGTFAAAALAQNRLFWLRLGEASGNFADSSGNSRTFTANGTISYGRGSLAKGDLLNNAIQPNGVNGYASRADEAAWDVGTITIGLGWSGTGINQTLIDRDDGGSNRFWRLEVDANGLLSFAINFTTGSPTRKLFIAPIKISDGQPHLIQAIYDKSFVSLYIDGNRVLHIAETRTMATGALGIRVGARGDGTNFSSGIFDEVFMVGRALTPLELLSEYQTWFDQRNELLFDRYRAHRVKIYYAVRMPSNGADGTPWAEYAQGVYILPTLARDIQPNQKVIASVSCQDQAAVLNDDKFSAGRYTVALGTNFVDAILAICQSSGFNTSAWAVTTTAKVTTADIDFEQDSSKLEAVNYLLQQIVYAPMRFSGEGAGIIEPNVLDADRPIAATFVADGDSVILVEGLSEQIETRKVPTQVIVTTGNPDTPDLLGSWKLGAKFSIVYGIGQIAIIPGDPPDQTTADALALQLLNDKLAKFARRMAMSTYPRPIHGYRDRIRVTIPQMGRDEDFIVEDWTISLSPSGKGTYSILSLIDVR